MVVLPPGSASGHEMRAFSPTALVRQALTKLLSFCDWIKAEEKMERVNEEK